MSPLDGPSGTALPAPVAAIRPRVAVQCRDRLLGDALVEWCGRQSPLVAVGPAVDGAALLRLCRTHHPVLVVVDAESGICETLAQLPPPRPYAIGLRSAHAPRAADSACDELIDRAAGLPPLAAALQAFLAHAARTGTAFQRLTTREAEVLTLLATGLRTAEMALLLGLSPRTVDNHRRRIYAKLGVQCASHAVATAASAGLLAPPATSPRPIPLTPRERQILELADRGLSTKQTARQLLVSAKTVENTWRHLYGKLGVHGRAEALAVVHRWGTEAGEAVRPCQT
ncbi:MAG: hypothetical protein HOW97_32770 [Catenulispora sp.]|nr:hypothetical protein [Catenulispora sp.]